VAEKKLDQTGRGLSAPGSQQPNAEEMLAELARLVESSGFALKRQPAPVEIGREQDLPASPPTQALGLDTLPLSLNATSDQPNGAVAVDVEPLEPRKPYFSADPSIVGFAAKLYFGAWTFRVSAFVLAGLAVIGSTYGLEQIMSKPSGAPVVTATAVSPATAQSRSNVTVPASSDAAVTSPSDITQPAGSKVIGPDERPIDQNARDSLEKPPPSQELASTGIDVAQPAGLPAGAPPVAPVNTPTLAEPATASPAAAPRSPDSKGALTVSLPTAPTTTVTPTPSATDSGVAAHASDARLPPVKRVPKPAVQAGASAQRPTPKTDSPAKPSSQTGAHTVAKAGATGPAATETKTPLTTAQASVEPQAAPPAQPAPAPQQPNPNPVARAFGGVMGAVGAVAGLIPFVPH
jgi:hypothetical protein